MQERRQNKVDAEALQQQDPVSHLARRADEFRFESVIVLRRISWRKVDFGEMTNLDEVFELRVGPHSFAFFR